MAECGVTTKGEDSPEVSWDQGQRFAHSGEPAKEVLLGL